MSLKSEYKLGGMFEGATHLLFENAKMLRNNMTEAEIILWSHLKDGINGYKVRRQHPISNYIADFFCFRLKLVIEIDGSVHNKKEVKENDDTRQKDLENLGYTVIRFTNQQVFEQTEIVLFNISEIANNIIQNKTPEIGV